MAFNRFRPTSISSLHTPGQVILVGLYISQRLRAILSAINGIPDPQKEAIPLGVWPEARI